MPGRAVVELGYPVGDTDTSFDVAPDHDPDGGNRSPRARSRGEVTDTEVEPSNS